MKRNYMFCFVIIVCLMSCGSTKDRKLEPTISKNVSGGKADDLVEEIDKNESQNSKEKTSDPVFQNGKHKKLVELFRDSINVDKLLKLKNVRYDEYDISIQGLKESAIDIVFYSSELAKNGDSEEEKWLLGFFDNYISGLRGRSFYSVFQSDEFFDLGGFRNPLNTHFEVSMSIALRNLPPSIEKTDVIAKLLGIFPYCTQEVQDVICTNSDNLAISLLLSNVPITESKKLIIDYELMYWDPNPEDVQTHKGKIKACIKYRQGFFNELKKKIINGSIPMIDRETWKQIK